MSKQCRTVSNEFKRSAASLVLDHGYSCVDASLAGQVAADIVEQLGSCHCYLISLNRREALNTCVRDGRAEIENNAAERLALGRKKSLFAGSKSGGERAAAMYSLIGSAKLNGIEPEAYLRDVLARIADAPGKAGQ